MLWINAKSDLKIPSAFAGNTGKISIEDSYRKNFHLLHNIFLTILIKFLGLISKQKPKIKMNNQESLSLYSLIPFKIIKITKPLYPNMEEPISLTVAFMLFYREMCSPP